MKIFISGASSLFRDCREQLRSDLEANDHTVRVQESFQTGTGTLLERIQDYITSCDRVIVLVGHAYGAEASGEGVPPCEPPRSYTQWEYFLAAGERLNGSRGDARDIHLYFASSKFAESFPLEEAPELAARQLTFVSRLEESNRHRKPFDSADQLCRWVLRDLQPVDGTPRHPVDDLTYRALGDVEDDVLLGRATTDPAALIALRQHSPRNARELHLHRVATWSDPKYAVDSRFTQLTLMLDRGPDGDRRYEQYGSFSDLRAVLAAVREMQTSALIVLGPPGSGKSTLLRRLEFDLAADALRNGRLGRPSTDSWTFFVSLASYHAPDGKPAPAEWLAQQWAAHFPHLHTFDAVSRSGHLTLLLDALNEMPHSGAQDYDKRLVGWRTYVGDLITRSPGTRVVFTCRSLDYGQALSTEHLRVPHVRIEELTDAQVESFLSLYAPDEGPRIWAQLKGTSQLGLFRSPFYLDLLLKSADGGRIPEGRAALFTRFLRRAVGREIEKLNPLFSRGGLLSDRDRHRAVNGLWASPYDLPATGSLMPRFAALAFGLQERRPGSDVGQVRAPVEDCLSLIGTDRTDDVLSAGVALQVLEDDRRRGEVYFVHQLLQEYFAARAAVAAGVAETTQLAASPWREDELEAVVFESSNEPLPPAPATGWEETFLFASAMAPSADAMVGALAAVNLPLAGRCAAQPDVNVTPLLKGRLQKELIARSRDADADLRSRIAAARALGDLGDPRLSRHRGPFGDYLVGPSVDVPAGEYSIGSDAPEALADERPIALIELATFSIGVFPVTNAEWRMFMASGGYEDDRWWDNDGARRWRSGEGTAEGPRQQARDDRRWWQQNVGHMAQSERVKRFTAQQIEDWEGYARMSEAEFESVIEEVFPGGRLTEPRFWNDPAFNHPSQPVVGVCWHEARAYCSWLSEQIGDVIRLPTEAEWEAAARRATGPRGRARTYAWGDRFDATCCNTFETHVRTTTPVGVFPKGDTPEGVSDMTGNVWEWTSSACEPYPYNSASGREATDTPDARRVLRGGSWYVNRDYARASFRYGGLPDYRNDLVGFRVVVSPIR